MITFWEGLTLAILTLNIRKARYGDIPALHRVEQVSFTERYPMSFLEEIYMTYPNSFLVAEINGVIVGYVIAVLRTPSVGHILSVAVAPAYRRRGIGRRLVEAAISSLERRGAREVRLEVRVSNKPAQSLYHSLGFKTTGIIPWYYRDGEAAYSMIRYLQRKSLDYTHPNKMFGTNHKNIEEL